MTTSLWGVLSWVTTLALVLGATAADRAARARAWRRIAEERRWNSEHLGLAPHLCGETARPHRIR